MLLMILAGCLAPIHGDRPVPSMYTVPRQAVVQEVRPGVYEVYENPGALQAELDYLTFGLLAKEPTYVIVEK